MICCPECESTNIEWVQSDTQRGYYWCRDCDHTFIGDAHEGEDKSATAEKSTLLEELLWLEPGEHVEDVADATAARKGWTWYPLWIDGIKASNNDPR
jgi:hypothetical protein